MALNPAQRPVAARWPLVELIGGLALLAIWATLQFAVVTRTGYIHIALAAGVLLVIRGIARLMA